jgi:hypothetical protein
MDIYKNKMSAPTLDPCFMCIVHNSDPNVQNPGLELVNASEAFNFLKAGGDVSVTFGQEIEIKQCGINELDFLYYNSRDEVPLLLTLQDVKKCLEILSLLTAEDWESFTEGNFYEFD